MQIHEKQRYTQWWIYAILIVLAVFIFLLHFVWKKDEWFHPNFMTAEIILVVVALLIQFIFLETVVDEKGIRFRFFPFIKWRQFTWDEIATVEVKKYMPIKEFGGWGIRYNFNYWCYTVKGRNGLLIKLTDGKQFLVGTQKPEKVNSYISDK